ncbi:YbaK/EbsC family protein [Candidatus Woesearchaeota archaeon]|nr:YbaK/EbsC family protein [Candidatus Woesearchaeota archaeon]
MNEYEKKLKKFLQENNVKGEHLHFENSVHTVEDACREVNAQPDDFVKTICMIANDGKVIGALVLGSHRASTERVASVLKIERPHVATPEQALKKTGYLVGGTPPFGYEATFLIDPKVMEKDIVYVGGGTPNALVKISPEEVQRIDHGIIARISK